METRTRIEHRDTDCVNSGPYDFAAPQRWCRKWRSLGLRVTVLLTVMMSVLALTTVFAGNGNERWVGTRILRFAPTTQTLVPESDRTLTFGGQPSITIPPGAVVISDSVALQVPALADLGSRAPSITCAARDREHAWKLSRCH